MALRLIFTCRRERLVRSACIPMDTFRILNNVINITTAEMERLSRNCARMDWCLMTSVHSTKNAIYPLELIVLGDPNCVSSSLNLVLKRNLPLNTCGSLICTTNCAYGFWILKKILFHDTLFLKGCRPWTNLFLALKNHWFHVIFGA